MTSTPKNTIDRSINESVFPDLPLYVRCAKIAPKFWSIECRFFLLVFLPKRLSVLINWWAVVARMFAGLVSVAAPKNGFREATTGGKVTIFDRDILGFFVEALIVDIPFFHLLEKQQFVLLVIGPAHMENIRIYLSLYELPHVLSGFLVVVEATGELVCFAVKDLDLQPVQRNVFRQQSDQGLLVGICFENHVTTSE